MRANLPGTVCTCSAGLGAEEQVVSLPKEADPFTHPASKKSAGKPPFYNTSRIMGMEKVPSGLNYKKIMLNREGFYIVSLKLNGGTEPI